MLVAILATLTGQRLMKKKGALRLLGALEDAEAEPPVLPPYRGSVVFDYFLRGRRRFSDLPASAFRRGRPPTPPAT